MKVDDVVVGKVVGRMKDDGVAGLMKDDRIVDGRVQDDDGVAGKVVGRMKVDGVVVGKFVGRMKDDGVAGLMKDDGVVDGRVKYQTDTACSWLVCHNRGDCANCIHLPRLSGSPATQFCGEASRASPQHGWRSVYFLRETLSPIQDQNKH